jgi:bacterioferritin (cytochrome b1)
LLSFKKQSNDKLTHDLQIEQKQTNSYRNQIETLNTEIYTLERLLNELKEEKNQLIQTKMDGDQDNERQNLVRQITQEKVDRYFI